MAKKISELPYTSSLTEQEFIEIVQNNQSKRTQIRDIKALQLTEPQTWHIVSDGAGSWKFQETNNSSMTIQESPRRIHILLDDPNLLTMNPKRIEFPVQLPETWHGQLIEVYVGCFVEGFILSINFGFDICYCGNPNFAMGYYFHGVYSSNPVVTPAIPYIKIPMDRYPYIQVEAERSWITSSDYLNFGYFLDFSTKYRVTRFQSIACTESLFLKNLRYADEPPLIMAWVDNGSGPVQTQGFPLEYMAWLPFVFILKNDATSASDLDVVINLNPTDIYTAQDNSEFSQLKGTPVCFCYFQPNQYNKKLKISLQNGWYFADGVNTSIEFGPGYGVWGFTLIPSLKLVLNLVKDSVVLS